MKYKFKFNLLYYALLAIAAAAFITSFVLSAINLSGSYELYSPALDIVNLIISLFILALLVSLIFVRFYKIKDSVLLLQLSFYRLKIACSRIVLIREDKFSKDMALYYKKSEDENENEIRLLMINIKKENNASFVAQIKKQNSAVVYELFDKNKTASGEDTNEL